MITRVWIDESEEECVSCGACEACADAIFRVDDKCRIVGTDFASYETEIKDAVDICPAEVLHYSEDEKNIDSLKGPALMSALAKVDMVEETKENELEPIDPDKVSSAIRDIPMLFYKRDVIDNMPTQTLTFKFAASVIHYLFPNTHVFLGGYSYSDNLSDCINPNLDDVKLVRARWTKPSNKMHYASPYDIEIDRKEIKYIMYIRDIRNKYVKTKRMKVALEDLNVGEFMDFVRTQFNIVQNNLPRRRR